MAKQRFIPTQDLKKVKWLNNFAITLESIGDKFDILPSEVQQTKKDAEIFQYAVSQLRVYRDELRERTAFKNMLIRDQEGTRKIKLPIPPPNNAPSYPKAKTGIFYRISKIVQRIKTHNNYTPSFGERLGIIGSERVVDLSKLKPTLKIIVSGGQPIIKWKKGTVDAIDIFVNRNDGKDWQLIARDIHPHFVDKNPIPEEMQSVLWSYRAVYVKHDEHVGEFSDTAHITLYNHKTT